jgi:hypothetical protein
MTKSDVISFSSEVIAFFIGTSSRRPAGGALAASQNAAICVASRTVRDPLAILADCYEFVLENNEIGSMTTFFVADVLHFCSVDCVPSICCHVLRLFRWPADAISCTLFNSLIYRKHIFSQNF